MFFWMKTSYLPPEFQLFRNEAKLHQSFAVKPIWINLTCQKHLITPTGFRILWSPRRACFYRILNIVKPFIQDQISFPCIACILLFSKLLHSKWCLFNCLLHGSRSKNKHFDLKSSWMSLSGIHNTQHTCQQLCFQGFYFDITTLERLDKFRWGKSTTLRCTLRWWYRANK